MRKIYCDICGNETSLNTSRTVEISIKTFVYNQNKEIRVNLDVCNDCRSNSRVLSNLSCPSDFESSESRDIFREEVINMLKKGE